jgi:exosortase/archaeosortase
MQASAASMILSLSLAAGAVRAVPPLARRDRPFAIAVPLSSPIRATAW